MANLASQRFGWLDYCKVLAIYLVVLGHTSIQPAAEQFIYVFHMPLFFFLAGYVFSFEKSPSYKHFLKKNINQLLLPYLLLNLITYVFWLFVSSRVGAETADIKESFYKPLIAIFYGHPKSLVHDVPLWFLLALFVVRNIFYLLYKNKRYALPSSALILSLAILIYAFNLHALPLCLDIVIIALPIFALGHYLRVKNPVSLNNTPLFLLSAAIVAIAFIYNGKVAMHVSQYNNLALFYLGGLAGCYAMIYISGKLHTLIGNRAIITFISTNTLLICAFHLPSFTVLKGLLLYGFGISPDKLSGTFLPNVALSLTSLIICLALSLLVNKYAPILIGYRNRPKAS